MSYNLITFYRLMTTHLGLTDPGLDLRGRMVTLFIYTINLIASVASDKTRASGSAYR